MGVPDPTGSNGEVSLTIANFASLWDDQYKGISDVVAIRGDSGQIVRGGAVMASLDLKKVSLWSSAMKTAKRCTGRHSFWERGKRSDFYSIFKTYIQSVKNLAEWWVPGFQSLKPRATDPPRQTTVLQKFYELTVIFPWEGLLIQTLFSPFQYFLCLNLQILR